MKDAATVLSEPFDPDDIDTIWVSWNDRLGNQEIATSEWLVPEGWTVVRHIKNKIFSNEQGETFPKSNLVTLSTTHQNGVHHIVNRITTDQGNQLDRGFYVQVSSRI